MGYNDLSDHLIAMGRLADALKCVTKSKEYCTTPKHLVEMSLRAIQLCIDMNNLGAVSLYSYGVKGNSADVDALTSSKVDLALGLLSLSNMEYGRAVDYFLQVKFDSSPGLNMARGDLVYTLIFLNWLGGGCLDCNGK